VCVRFARDCRWLLWQSLSHGSRVSVDAVARLAVELQLRDTSPSSIIAAAHTLCTELHSAHMQQLQLQHDIATLHSHIEVAQLRAAEAQR
jgi:hypothetical protein